MFTGLIQDTGRIVRTVHQGRAALMTVSTAMENPQWIRGESIAVNGVCLTLVNGAGGEFDVDISPETLRRSTLGTLSPGEAVNLERAMRLSDRLGGHLVTGHVDAVGIKTLRKDMGDSLEMEISIPEALMPLMVEKGSIAVDGVSLTVNALRKAGFTVAIIPHTMAGTTLGRAKAGRRVNIETDILGKYVYRYLAERGAGQQAVTEEFLARHGFV